MEKLGFCPHVAFTVDNLDAEIKGREVIFDPIEIPGGMKMAFILSIMFAAICPVSSDLYLPSVLFIATSLHISITLLQLSIVVFVFGVSIARLIFGIVSDAFGRKTPIIVGCNQGRIAMV